MELLIVIFTVAAVIGVQSQLTNISQIDGSPFTITCDASRLTIPSTVTVIYSLSIERTLYTSSQSQLIASYTPFLTPYITQPTQPNRQWLVNGQGTTRNNMKLELTILDATCADAGVYRCNATYKPTPTGSSADRMQNISGKVKTEEPTIALYPHNGNDAYFSQNEPGRNVTLICSVMGPQRGLSLSWMYGPTNTMSLIDYPYKNDIKETYPTTPSGDLCISGRYGSVLSIKVESQEMMYVCVVRDNNVQVRGRIITIGNPEGV